MNGQGFITLVKLKIYFHQILDSSIIKQLLLSSTNDYKLPVICRGSRNKEIIFLRYLK